MSAYIITIKEAYSSKREALLIAFSDSNKCRFYVDGRKHNQKEAEELALAAFSDGKPREGRTPVVVDVKFIPDELQ